LIRLHLPLLFICAFFITSCSAAATPTRFIDTPTTASSSTVTPRPTASLSPLEVASAVLSDLAIETQSLYSPDGRCTWHRLQAWSMTEAAQRKYEHRFFISATVTCVRAETNEKVNWLLVDEWKEQGLGYSIPALLGWSADGNYLYFYDNIIPDGCQPLGGFQDNLRQVDLDTGDILSLLMGLKSGYSLSPDTTRLVFYDIQTADIGSYDFASGKVQHFPLAATGQADERWVGDLTWSPDGRSLLFVVIYGDPCYPGGASILHLDPQSGQVKILLTTEGQILSIIDWVASERVLISVGGEQHALDPSSGVLEP